MSDIIDPSEPKLIDRRNLLRVSGMAGLGLLGTSLLAGCGGGGDGSSIIDPGDGGGGGNSGATQDRNVLNFALNLEYLEAEYYLRGTTGAGLSAGDSGTGAGAVTGGTQVTFSTPEFREYAEEIAADELAHVRFLRSALGANAVARPAINFTDAFNAAAQAAGLGNSFNPFENEVNFLIGAFVFEDVGVTAYNGAATLISNKAFLQAAAGILGVEAYHAGSIRTVLNAVGGQAVSAANAISDLRASVGGGKDQGFDEGVGANIVPADANAIAFARTTREVLNIVYLNGNGTPGGFFPNGLNGAIR
ncbi:MAG: ferritin-like domain-containing protein [Fimbriimonas sp.]